MAEVIRPTPIAFENRVTPDQVPSQPLARWRLTWHNPHAKVPDEEPHIVRETHPMTYKGVVSYARRRTRYYENVILWAPTHFIDAPELE